MHIEIIIFVIILSALIGIVIANFAKIKGYIRGEIQEIKEAPRSPESLTSAISREISTLSASPYNRKKAVEAVSHLFKEELDKHINSVAQKITKKYEKTLSTTKQAAEIIEKKYEKLKVEKKQTEAVIRSIAEGLVVVNEKGEVLLMNPAAEELLGVQKEQKIGKPILKDLKSEQLISLVSESADKENQEIELTSADDETRKVLRASSAVIENEYGKTVGMVSVLTDVTKQRELDRLKSEFISKVSHELRTPIVTVQNSVDLVLSKATGPLTESQEKFLAIAQRNLKRLSLLINDLLDISKIDAAKMELELAPCSLVKIINDVCESLSAWANSKAIRIEKKISSDIPKINLDAHRIIQVLNNIIGNAIKFTPRNGKVTIEAGLDREKKQVFVSVTDTGVGIAKEDLDKVFEKFRQVGERVSTDLGGTGLGLSIAKELVKLHNGQIWVESEKGQGAKFTFTLPLSAT
jgi:PAS domain S-box-containing protein